jgi:hypothetical protein
LTSTGIWGIDSAPSWANQQSGENPNLIELELFDGSDRSLDSFFRMFPNLKLTPPSVRSKPRAG